MRYHALIGAVALLGACVMPAPDPIVDPVPPPGQGCDAARFQHLLGGPLPDPFPREGAVRVYETGMALTMDYDPNRLNVELAPANRRIVSITCG